ncbi:glycosyltransferase family 2 protein [Gillisia sp. Hel_I_29]|uniref:glycosyltransferase family 2 protein n=1 Tax=Gillisia sp. Hel_I_29 TaxID=1249975 RepID=UPI00068980F0|nr:glycosyltransferase family A protein [Gillisia sp. Hel_I_29]
MNLDTHLISIIIPTFNRSNTLRRAIESVLNQSLSFWELIIVDDGSTDNTREVIESYIRNPKVSYYYQKNKGVSTARNYGALQANGDFLIFLDSDDYIFPDLIFEIHSLNLTEYDLVCWYVLKTLNGKKNIWKPTRLDSMYKNLKVHFLAGSIAYRKSVFFEIGGYDEEMFFGENYELGLRWSNSEALNIYLINKPLSGYIVETSLRTSDNPLNKLLSYFHLIKKHKIAYSFHPKQHSQLLYMIGYNLENINKNKFAYMLYFKSWQTYPYKIKALLKIIYLKISI